MNQTIDRTDDSEFQADRLADLRDQVNKVGQEIAVVEGERNSLPQWQADAVGQIIPVLQDVAAETTQAINTFQADKSGLFASD
jgi:hypothetical protein